LISIEHAQHVRLIFGKINGPMQLDLIPSTEKTGIVTCADGIKAERDTALQNR